MREILFRGRANDGTWYEGSLHKSTNEYPNETLVSYKIQEFNYGFADEFGFEPTYMSGFDEFVSAETIGQYTGLTDKNGKKIFEGDIVKGWDVIFTVIFDEYCRYMIVAGHGNYLLAQNNEDVEVIGNIHDNLELLKGERE